MSGWNKTVDWFWEGNIQKRITKYMENQEGFQIIKSCGPGTKGPDIIAKRCEILRQVEVKGYPSDKYVSGPNEGQKKRTNPRLQAKHWFGEALLALLLAKSKNSKLEIALGLPEHPRYTSLLKDTSWARKIMGIYCYMVDASGGVKLLQPPLD